MGPMLDAATRKPIWRHEILDADGICSPGVSNLTDIVILKSIRKKKSAFLTNGVIMILYLKYCIFL